MKPVLMLIVSVLVFDAFIARSFFNLSWALPGLSLVIFAVTFVLIRPRKKKVSPGQGWLLGEALELTDPNHPVPVKRALISKKVLNLGVIAMGAQGTGKTESVILGQAKAIKSYAPESGYALFDGKGDIDTYKKFVAMGAKPDHFFSSELEGSDAINLFSGEPVDVTDRLTALLIGETTSTTFYADDQRAVLARIIPLFSGLQIPVNLKDLYVGLAVPQAGRDLLKAAKARHVDSDVIRFAEGWFEQPARTRMQNIAGLLNRLIVFITGPDTDRLNCYQPDIDFAQMVENGETFYGHLPLTAFSKDVAVAMINMFEVEARKRQLAGTDGLDVYPLFFDDWSGFFHAGFAPFSARCRSAEMPLSFGFQSKAHLDAVSHTFLNALDDTVATKIIMRTQGGATAEYVRRLLCEFETPEIMQSDSVVRGETMSMRKQDRIDARALRELNPGEACISTLLEEGGKTRNPLWKVQLKRPDFTGWENIQLPPPKTHDIGKGLNFWEKYMRGEDMRILEKRIAEMTARAKAGEDA
ncbi:MAG: hypothetical protein ACE5F7_05010 [Nitrospiria bacterium]